jgi:hypothetical protein
MLKSRWMLLMAMCVLIVPAAARGQERRQGGPPPYNPANEITVSAKVLGTETIEVGDRPAMLLLTIDLKGVPTNVIMAPVAWMQKQGIAFKEGDTVAVTGLSGYKANGKPAMMPRSVKAGTKTLTLRDAEGNPVWESRP